MEILLCISAVPDTTTKITFSSDHKQVDLEGATLVISPYDDHALGKAMELKEKHKARVTVVNVGDKRSDQVLRKALAVGADEAFRIDTVPQDAFQVARELTPFIQERSFDIVFCGRESVDYNGGLVPDLLGEMLGWPSVSYVIDIDIEKDPVELTRGIDAGEEKLAVKTPFVMGASKELAEWRIPNMRGIMQAKKKKLTVLAPKGASANTQTVRYEPPKQKGQVRMIDPANVDELVDILQNEAKVI
jgi:electron transfer flavoprotein beta subunit